MPSIQNPVLSGFHPDPSICKVDDDFYIATSTFEWFPGGMIYHSRDLRNWRLVAKPLDRLDLLDMRGEESSCGVWAPCLSHDGEKFHLVYSDTKSKTNVWDVTNYLTTATTIKGPWSKRVTLNRCGFDPSMFHDTDGRKWVLTLSQDTRPDQYRFGGIELQEYDPIRETLVGEPRIIFTGTKLKATEGPHLYHIGDWYYLMVAEGGTSWNHAITVARAKEIQGPYDVDPEFPMLTAADAPDAELQKAGHGSIVEVTPGSWVLAHLCGRPVNDTRRCILGRETALQRVVLTPDGWFRLENGGHHPEGVIESFDLPESPVEPLPEIRRFDQTQLPEEFQTLREPMTPDWGSLSGRPGWLRLFGRRSLYSNFEQSLVGRRIQHFTCEAETRLDYGPSHFQQTAGLVAWYDDQSFYALRITFEPGVGRVLRLTCSDNHKETYPCKDIPLPEGPIRLLARLDHEDLHFAWAADDGDWRELGVTLDATVLADEYGDRWRFTGAFFALHAQDMTMHPVPADFEFLRYTPQETQVPVG